MLLPQKIALPVFAREVRSSAAYAPDEILLAVAVAGGSFATTHSGQIGLGVVLVMLVVMASLRPFVMGPPAGLTVARVLLVSYACSPEGVPQPSDGPGVGLVRCGL
jgi:hypothetical protein